MNKGYMLKREERETLAHIVQNIDEQEIFLEFVAKAETIKESWQIARIFENKKKELAQNILKYDSIIKSKEEELATITGEINEANNLLQDANKELEAIRIQLEEMRSKAQFFKNTILQGKQFPQPMSEFTREGNEADMLDLSAFTKEFKPLASVSVHLKNGQTASARVAQSIYSKELYDYYKKMGARLMRLRDRVKELELENQKLSVELRDLSAEDNLRANMHIESSTDRDDLIEIMPNVKHEDNIDSLNLDNRLKVIDKKKEKVEEMFNQLNEILRDTK